MAIVCSFKKGNFGLYSTLSQFFTPIPNRKFSSPHLPLPPLDRRWMNCRLQFYLSAPFPSTSLTPTHCLAVTHCVEGGSYLPLTPPHPHSQPVRIFLLLRIRASNLANHSHQCINKEIKYKCPPRSINDSCFSRIKPRPTSRRGRAASPCY